MFAYFWNSEIHLNNFVFWTELCGSLIEVVVAMAYLLTLGKQITEAVKKQREHRIELFALVAAIILPLVVVCSHRIGQLQETRIAEINPLKHPVLTATASAHFSVVSGFDLNRIDRSRRFVSSLIFSQRWHPINRADLSFTSETIEALAGSECFINFTWDSSMAFFLPTPKTVGETLASLDKCSLSANNIKPGSDNSAPAFEITGGEVTLILNSTVQKKFILLPQKPPFPLIDLVGIESGTNISRVTWKSDLRNAPTVIGWDPKLE
jgi:hypothetical protein